MNIIRSERLILVNPISLPDNNERVTYSPRSITTCSLQDVRQAATQAWQEGFFPLLVFEKAAELHKWGHNIPLSYSRWDAFAQDKEPKRLAWLFAHPTLEVLRGLANRDLLALPDESFHTTLNAWIEQDATASSLLQQLRDGQLVPKELEPIPTQSNQSNDKHFRACWQLDPRVTLDIIYTANQIVITAQAEEAPLPKSLGEFGDVRNFVINNLVLDCHKDKSLIRSLSHIWVSVQPPPHLGTNNQSLTGESDKKPTNSEWGAERLILMKDLFGRLVEIFIDKFDPLGDFQLAFAAGIEEKTDLELFLSSGDGAKWSLYIMVDQDDPSQKSIQLFCNSAGYEGHEVMLRKNDTLILKGTIERGRPIEAVIPEGMILDPPYELLFLKGESRE